MPFANQILGGSSILVRPAIKSPNYVPGVSGWSINKDGSAEFHSIVVPPGTSGNTVFTQGTAPVALAVNDLWVDTALGNAVFIWSGAAWVPFQWGANAIANGAITTGLLAANAVTAAKLAAGIVYAGIVDATTINAATFIGSVFQGTEIIINDVGTFWYRGVPGANTLRMSAVGTIASVQDPFGNWALPGLTIYAGTGPYSAYEYFANAISTATATVMTGVSDPWTAANAIVYQLPGMILKGPITAIDGTSASPTKIITDTFNALTLAGTWSNNGADVLKASLMPDNSIWINGRISNTANQVSGAVIGTLGAGYFNLNRNSFGVGAIANSNTAMPMEVSTTGSFTITGPYTLGTALIINMRYPLGIT